MVTKQTRRYTAEDVARIVMDVPQNNDISGFEGKEGDPESGMDESNTDSGK